MTSHKKERQCIAGAAYLSQFNDKLEFDFKQDRRQQ